MITGTVNNCFCFSGWLEDHQRPPADLQSGLHPPRLHPGPDGSLQPWPGGLLRHLGTVEGGALLIRIGKYLIFISRFLELKKYFTVIVNC